MALHPSHFVAVIGGAVAGSVAAAKLADRGIKVAVFEQNTRPYGKIEDGLPKWHVKLQAQEEGKIDERLSHPNIFFVPDTKLGRDIDFGDMVKNWGLSAILLANGAWRDRPLPIKGVDDFVGKGLIYQNPLVKWFNHYHESQYQGPSYHIPDDALIVGGGLASLDVVKIVMLETVQEALRKQGIDVDMLTLEHETIHKVLDDHKLSLAKLGLKGCRLYYRRRIKDMPLATVPPDATPERREKVYMAREKILRNFQEKFLFSMHECQAPSGVVTENGRLVGIIFEVRLAENPAGIDEVQELRKDAPGTQSLVPNRRNLLEETHLVFGDHQVLDRVERVQIGRLPGPWTEIVSRVVGRTAAFRNIVNDGQLACVV